MHRMTRVSLEQWETFYRGGLLATGPTGADGLYDLEVAEAWDAFFRALPQQAHLLDIGTGNGVLPLMAVRHAEARGADWRIEATDLARIDPLRDVADGARRFAGVRFHPQVANERLPFETGVFDGASAHYALEYGNTAATFAEVARVLRPGASVQCVLHHTDSVLVQSARRSMAECDLVFKQSRLYRRLHRLVTLEAARPEVLQHAQQELTSAIRLLRQALAEAQARQAGAGRILSVALDAARALLASRQQQRGALVGLEVDRAETELRTAWRRLNDLVEHAVDAPGIQRMQSEAGQAGLQPLTCELLFHNRQHLVGWLLRLRRA